MYSVLVVNSEELKKAKGVKKNTVENTKHKKFVHVLFNRKMMRHKMKGIQSKLHRIFNL